MDTGFRLEDLPEAMDDWEKERESQGNLMMMMMIYTTDLYGHRMQSKGPAGSDGWPREREREKESQGNPCYQHMMMMMMMIYTTDLYGHRMQSKRPAGSDGRLVQRRERVRETRTSNMTWWSIYLYFKLCRYRYILVGMCCGLIVIVLGNWLGDTGSNPWRDYLHFT